MDLTRRHLLGGAGANAIVTGLEAVLGKDSFAASQESNIEKLKKIRQEELEQLVNPFYANILYDHDRAKAKTAVKNNPNRKEMEDLIERVYVVAIHEPNSFGKPLKTALYFFPEFFESRPLKTTTGELILQPTIASKKAKIAHELLHAEDYFNTIRLENGQIIDSSNYYKLNGDVTNFVVETRGYIKEIEEARRLEKPEMTFLQTGDLRNLPPAYLSAMIGFITYLSEKSEKVFNVPTLTPFERDCVENQMHQIKTRTPEILKLIFYRR